MCWGGACTGMEACRSLRTRRLRPPRLLRQKKQTCSRQPSPSVQPSQRQWELQSLDRQGRELEYRRNQLRRSRKRLHRTPASKALSGRPTTCTRRMLSFIATNRSPRLLKTLLPGVTRAGANIMPTWLRLIRLPISTERLHPRTACDSRSSRRGLLTDFGPDGLFVFVSRRFVRQAPSVVRHAD